MLSAVRGSKKWQRLLTAMSCLVVFVTTYALILPAITMTKPAYCGKQEHTHSEECYQQQLICQLPEELNHEHTAQCYGSVKNLLCGLEECPGHTHTEACAETVTSLCCGFAQESEEHTHIDGCYATETKYICGQEEAEGHTHTDECYTTIEKEVCTPHVHDEACYVRNTVCGLMEHSHTDECYVVPDESESQNPEQWEEKLPELTGHWAKDLLAAVQSQMGYAESVVDVNDEGNGRSIYGTDYGVPYVNWDAAFVSWCLDHLMIPDAPSEEVTEFFPRNVNTVSWAEALKAVGKFYEGKGGLVPRPGDLMFFSVDAGRQLKRVAVVVDTRYDEEGTLTEVRAIMGDCEDRVDDIWWNVGALTIQGWARLPVNPDHPELYTEEEFTAPPVVPPVVEEEKEEAEDNEPDEGDKIDRDPEAVIEIETGTAEGLGENFQENNFDAVAFALDGEGNELDESLMVSLFSLEDEGIMSLEEEPNAPLNVRDYILNNSTGVVVKWHESHDASETGSMPWKDLPSDGTELPANAHLRVEVKYANVKPEDLKASDYEMLYYPGDLLTDLLADGDILVNNVPHGTITVVETEDGRAIKLKFDPEWVNGLVANNADPNNQSNKRTISGDFYFQGELDLEKLDQEENKELNLGPIKIKLPVSDDAYARYAEADITKQNPRLVTVGEGENVQYFLEYSLEVSTGKYGIPGVKVTDTLTNKSANGVEFIGSHPYVGLREAQVPASKTVAVDMANIEIMPVEQITFGDGGHSATATRNGLVYYTSNPTYSQEHYGELDPTGESLVWDVGDMGPYEHRTLTYRVAVHENYVGINHPSGSTITNTASLTANKNPHGTASTRTAPNGTASINKQNSRVEGPSEAGKYKIYYTITVKAPASNNYTMTNLKVYDVLSSSRVDSMVLMDSEGNPVLDPETGKQITYWDLVDYNFTNEDTADITIDGMSIADFNQAHTGENQASVEVLNDVDGQRTPYFDLYIGDLAPGSTRTITYSMTLDSRTAAMGNNVGIDNRAQVHDDDTKNGGNKRLDDSSTSVNPSGQRWDRKLGGDKLTLGQRIPLSRSGVYVKSNGSYTQASNPPAYFDVPAGAFSYTVIVNEKGEWDVSATALQDSLGVPSGMDKSPLMFSGYLRLDVYDKLTEDSNATDAAILGIANTTEPVKTIWVEINGDRSFDLNARAFGIDPNEDGKTYVLRYYAAVDDSMKVSNVVVGNEFAMSGTIGNGSGTIYLNGVRASKTVTATGVYQCKIRKEFWYYDAEDHTFSYVDESGKTVYPGSLYWAIKIDATKIANGTVFQESVNGYQSFNTILRKPNSLLGFYIGNIDEEPGAGKSTAYIRDVFETYQDLVSSGRLHPVLFDYTMAWTSGGQNNNNGWSVEGIGAYGENVPGGRGANFDLTISVNQDVGIAPNESVYLLVKTEPFRLPNPSGEANSKNYSNKVNHYDPLNPPTGGSWPNYSAETAIWDGSTGLEKKAGNVFKVSDADNLTWEQYRGNYVNNTYTSGATFQKYMDSTASTSAGFTSMNGVHWGNGSDGTRANEPIPISMMVKGKNLADLATYYDISRGRTYQHTNDQALNYRYKDGVYVTWNITLNKTLQLKQGAYTIIDELPAGVELAYIRTLQGVSENYNVGSMGLQNAKYRVTGDNAKYADWAPHAVAAPRAGDTWLTTYTNYYTKDNQVAIYVPTLYANTQPVFQVVCRVTDPNAYYEDVELTNVAKLYDSRDFEIDARSSTIWARNGSLSKADLASSGTSLGSNVLPYELVLNETAGDMQPGADTVSVPLIDHMSSNLSVNMDTLRVYAGSVDSNHLIYDGGNERAPILAGSSRLYYAVNNAGQQLFWQGTAPANMTDSVTDFRVFSTKADSYGHTTQINGTDKYFYVASVGGEVIASDEFSSQPTAYSSASGIPEGKYIIQGSSAGDYVTDRVTNATGQNRLQATRNRNDATAFYVSKVGTAYVITSNGKYMAVPANATAQMQAEQRLITFTSNSNYANSVAIRDQGSNQYLNHYGGNSADKYGGYSSNDGGSALYLYRSLGHTIEANEPLYWDSNAQMGTTPTDYPVLTTNPAASAPGVRFELLTKDAGTGKVTGNVPNAFHKVNEYGQPLYQKADGTETTEAEGNTPVMVTTNIRVAVEPYVNEAGAADGTKIIKFFDLPDSTKLIIKYDVAASLVSGVGNSYANEAYWDEHGSSGDSMTGSDNMTLDVEGTATAEVHGAVKITKYNGADTSEKLAGAEFTLYRAKYIMGAKGSEWTLYEDKNESTGLITERIEQNTGDANYPAIYSVTGTGDSKQYTPMNPVRDVEDNLRGFMIDGSFVAITNTSLATMTFEHKLDLKDGKPQLDPTPLAAKTTGTDGVVSYGFLSTESNIHFNKVYAVKETVAPEGYDLDEKVYYFVVPNDKMSGTGMNYFFHNNESDFPEEVYVVRRSQNDVMTYFLDVYDYKGTVQVMKEFGGNGSAETNYKPGTYRFGIWPAKYVDSNGEPWGNEYRVDSGSITYAQTDFGWFRESTDSSDWREYRQNGNRWQSRAYTYDADGNETMGQWSNVSAKPADAVYGILPNCRKVITFKDLTFNEDYYVFELDVNGFPILSTGTVGNDKFFVSYGSPAGQEPIYIPGTDKLAVEGNRVTPFKGQPGSIVVPVVIATNRSLEITVSKDFVAENQELASGLYGTYRFGLWAVPASGTPDLTKQPLQIQSITWSRGDIAPVHQARFTNLDPGNYVVYELSGADVPAQEGELCITSGKTFTVSYGGTNELTITANSSEQAVVNVSNEVTFISLPHTGGIGTSPYTFAGLALMAIAGLSYITLLKKRRREARK